MKFAQCLNSTTFQLRKPPKRGFTKGLSLSLVLTPELSVSPVLLTTGEAVQVVEETIVQKDRAVLKQSLRLYKSQN